MDARFSELMDTPFSESSPAHLSVITKDETRSATKDESRSRQPLWPAFVIAFAIFVTLLWAGTLLWLLCRILLLY